MNSKHQVLIVDDEPLNVKLLASILSVDGYDIISAFNGEQALEKVIETCPDLILLDIMMPGIDGFEVTRRLKKSFDTKDIPIILITAFDNADVARALDPITIVSKLSGAVDVGSED